MKKCEDARGHGSILAYGLKFPIILATGLGGGVEAQHEHRPSSPSSFLDSLGYLWLHGPFHASPSVVLCQLHATVGSLWGKVGSLLCHSSLLGFFKYIFLIFFFFTKSIFQDIRIHTMLLRIAVFN